MCRHAPGARQVSATDPGSMLAHPSLRAGRCALLVLHAPRGSRPPAWCSPFVSLALSTLVVWAGGGPSARWSADVGDEGNDDDVEDETGSEPHQDERRDLETPIVTATRTPAQLQRQGETLLRAFDVDTRDLAKSGDPVPQRIGMQHEFFSC